MSDLNDPDDDNDLLPDTVDFFALDPENGASTDLPVFLTWNNGEPPRGGILNLGFTGLMQNGSDYLTLFDPDKIIPGGAPGVCTVIEDPDERRPRGGRLAALGLPIGHQHGTINHALCGPGSADRSLLGRDGAGLDVDGALLRRREPSNYLSMRRRRRTAATVASKSESSRRKGLRRARSSAR